MGLECGRIVEKVGELFGLHTEPDTTDGDGVRSCCTRCDSRLGFDTLSVGWIGADTVTAGLREKIPNTMVMMVRETSDVNDGREKERKKGSASYI